MRDVIIILLVGLCTMPALAQQKEAKDVLDKTAAAFRKAGGVDAEFTVKIKAKGQTDGLLAGNIRLKGDKFVLKTTDAITWFDGETQWSYLVDSDEVNISNPTEEELQGINPYALLSLYEKEFAYTLGSTRTFKGTPIHEVVLTTTDKSKDISRLTLYIAKGYYQLLYVLAELYNGSKNEITIINYRSGVKLDDAIFTFDRKQYPRAEIIDLR